MHVEEAITIPTARPASTATAAATATATVTIVHTHKHALSPTTSPCVAFAICAHRRAKQITRSAVPPPLSNLICTRESMNRTLLQAAQAMRIHKALNHAQGLSRGYAKCSTSRTSSWLEIQEVTRQGLRYVLTITSAKHQSAA
ncbi:hypothetical protein EGR_05552 [Echinococcus granulosus]|uniref:Uncharacterized protein n=1 Tax=Echinococcus granulosus TaxID=6210 RepID=W6UDT6_ECHGR|nr:hypothetical protein EGR_05552 [Echinococcus granulosus]EUB59525.1 hypothetical protein EGR_05552 [Echinococcus granulosus]